MCEKSCKTYLQWFSLCVLLDLCFTNSGVTSTAGEQITVKQGDTAVLPCSFNAQSASIPPYVIQWLRKGDDMPIIIKIGNRPSQTDATLKDRMSIPDETSYSASLRIRNVSSDDATTYVCKVVFLQTNNHPTRQDVIKTVELNVTVPPTFVRKSPPEQRGRLGAALFLQCLAKGNPHPVIIWMKDGLIISKEQGVEIKGGELKIRSLQREDAGRYVCTARSLEGVAQHAITVHVSAPPLIKRKPQNARVTERQDVTFSCDATGYPTEITYRWYHNGRIVPGSHISRSRHSVLNEGTLVIRNISISDGGQITCEADNGYGSAATATALLVVEYAARVTGMPEMVFGGVSRPVKINCPSAAYPPVIRVHWKKNSVDLRIGQNRRYTTDGNGSLIIYEAREKDMGKYTCTPYNVVGNKGSGSTILQVRALPRFVLKPSASYTTKVGDAFEAPCSGFGEPSPVVSWRKVKNVPKDLVYCLEGGNLTINAVRKEHHGVWQCVLSSQVGYVTTDVNLIVENTTPHKLGNVSATVLDESSILLKWDPGYDGGLSQHFMVWYKKPEQGDHAWKKLYVQSGHKMAVVKHLKTNTIYQLTIKAVNQHGDGPFTRTLTLKTKDIVVVTTLSPQPVPIPDQLSYSITKEGLIKLTWQPLCCSPELLGFLIEHRRLGKATSPGIEPLITKTVAMSKSKEKDIRKRRSVYPSDKWTKFDTTRKNETFYEIKKDRLYRDQVYEFQVLAVTHNQYSQPTTPLVVSTEGMGVYPRLTEPVGKSSLQLHNPVAIAVISGILVACLLAAVVLGCHCKRRAHRMRERKRSLKVAVDGDIIKPDYQDARCSISQEDTKPLPHLKDDDYNVSSSIKTSQYDGLITSSGAKVPEESWTGLVEDGDYGDERVRFLCLNSFSSSEKERSKCFRTRSSDDSSVRKRREMAVRVFKAQKLERFKDYSNPMKIDSLPPRPVSATPLHPRNNTHQYLSNKITVCPVSLEDRRQEIEGKKQDEPVYVVVCDETKKQRPTSFTSSSYKDFSYPSNAPFDNQHILHPEGRLSLPQSAICPRYGANPNFQDCFVSCSPSNKSTEHRLIHRNLSSPSSNANQLCFHFRDTTTTSVSNRQRPSLSASDAAYSYNCQRSRSSRSFDRTEARYSRYKDGLNGSSEKQAFEIDCSNSEVLLRFVNNDSNPQKSNSTNKKTKGNSVSEREDFNLANFKVETDTMDETEKITLSPRPSSIKVPLRHHQGGTASQKRVSLEALLSPSLVIPHHLATAQESNNGFFSENKRDSSFLERKKAHGSEASLNHGIKNNRKSWNRYVSACGTDGNISTSPVCSNLTFVPQDASSPLFTKEDGTFTQLARPTVISLADVSWKFTRRRRDSDSASSQLSPISSQCSPHKRESANLNHVYPYSETPFQFSSKKECRGSLERPSKLKKKSFQKNSPEKHFIKTFSQKKSRSTLSLKSTMNYDSSFTVEPSSMSGIHSLPVSPTKKFTFEFLRSSAEARRKNSLPFETALKSVSLSGNYRSESAMEANTSMAQADTATSGGLTSSQTSQIGSPISFRRHRAHGESISSGYVTQDVSLTSPGFFGSTSGERTRKDNSSVEDNYEWDSACAAESEILDALKQFNNFNKTSSMSTQLRNELNKFASDSKEENEACSGQHPPKEASETELPEGELTYSKETIEKRCAALKKEFFNFKLSQEVEENTRQEQVKINKHED